MREELQGIMHCRSMLDSLSAKGARSQKAWGIAPGW